MLSLRSSLLTAALVLAAAPSAFAAAPTEGDTPRPRPLNDYSARTCVVPDLVGKDIEAAEDLMNKAGCSYGTLDLDPESSRPTWEVTWQNAAPGSVVDVKLVRISIKIAGSFPEDW